MDSAYSFAVPSAVPQDLLLIRDIIGDIPVPSTAKLSEASTRSDPDHGTDSDTDSEQEVEAGILVDVGEDDVDAPSESTSDSDSSSDSEDEEEMSARKTREKPVRAEMDEDDDGEPAATSEAQVRTKNEVVEADVVIPEISEVSADEQLEKVGEIMNILDKVVIVKGVASQFANRGSERALDSDTLLVFEDRKVFGYIFETFGPTSEPLYQVRFNQKFPLDPEKVQVGRPVFHVPTKSHYVFVQQLRHLKGSDASNVNDEEPGDDELEFSDDEAEAAYKRAQTQRREQSRARSVMSSRHSTPVPARMRDQDMIDDPYGGSSSYAESRPYNDMDFAAGPSRPAPIPYDDPYSDAYGTAPPEFVSEEEEPRKSPVSPSQASRGHDRGRGRGRGGPRDLPSRHEEFGGGRGRGRRHNDRDRGRGRGRGRGRTDPTHPPRSLSPTSLAIAHATGQYADGSAVPPDMNGGGDWGYPQYPPMQPFDFAFPYQFPQVQPHINPRFAANFVMPGMGMGFAGYGAQSAPYTQDASGYAVPGNPPGGWSGSWGGPSQPHPGQGNGYNG
ncbi:NAF1-domain-containing protein [Lentinus brumalis]|uniref:H/ACA ribonucleoprotein complex non-core subunit NAF1 n=1 Tax=Lentinus brumalis TaxID=2498619 RepID=A0A371DF18_9APHY|nr:NAF1-domain-containing protein [Polyporus brumalis]